MTMRKRISIDELKIGMKVEKLDRSWLATSFLRHRFTITSSEQITQLYASGVRQLEVELKTNVRNQFRASRLRRRR